MIPRIAIALGTLLQAAGIRKVVSSPGSRNAPLTLSFSRLGFDIKVVNDERTAAFIALGMAQQCQEPVVLICTSGSAAANYSPALAEAFYRNVPLLVLTADRPPEWIGQYDGQTLDQGGLYENITRWWATLPLDDGHSDTEWHQERLIGEALSRLQSRCPGPVHLNVPFREPFYPETSELPEISPPKHIVSQEGTRVLDNKALDGLKRAWAACERPLLIVGQLPYPSHHLLKEIENLAGQLPVVADITSGLKGQAQIVGAHDFFLPLLSDTDQSSLQPDGVIYLGNGVLSKSFKKFIRQARPRVSWRISEDDRLVDTFQSATRYIQANPADTLARVAPATHDKSTHFLEKWMGYQQQSSRWWQNDGRNLDYGEAWACHQLLLQLPETCTLHLANSMPVRYADMIPLTIRPHWVHSNRGVSGIDGCTSTALGSALLSENMHILITGDVAFIYDQHAFWQETLPANFKVMILNNRGGGIFRMIDGPSQQPELEKLFVGHQGLDFSDMARTYGLAHYQAVDKSSFARALTAWLQPADRPAVLEVQTDGASDASIYRELRKARLS